MNVCHAGECSCKMRQGETQDLMASQQNQVDGRDQQVYVKERLHVSSIVYD